MNETWRQYGISSDTDYKWKASHCGLEPSDVKRPKNWNTKQSAQTADLSLDSLP
jgi:hypothetical protein